MGSLRQTDRACAIVTERSVDRFTGHSASNANTVISSLTAFIQERQQRKVTERTRITERGKETDSKYEIRHNVNVTWLRDVTYFRVKVNLALLSLSTSISIFTFSNGAKPLSSCREGMSLGGMTASMNDVSKDVVHYHRYSAFRSLIYRCTMIR